MLDTFNLNKINKQYYMDWQEAHSLSVMPNILKMMLVDYKILNILWKAKDKKTKSRKNYLKNIEPLILNELMSKRKNYNFPIECTDDLYLRIEYTKMKNNIIYLVEVLSDYTTIFQYRIKLKPKIIYTNDTEYKDYSVYYTSN